MPVSRTCPLLFWEFWVTLTIMVQRQTREWGRVLLSIGLVLLAAGVLFTSGLPFAARIGSAVAIFTMVGLMLLYNNHSAGPTLTMAFLAGIDWAVYYYNGESFYLICGVLFTGIFLYRLTRYREGTMFMPSN